MATLGFSTEWPKHMGGKPTNFILKIWTGIVEKHPFTLCDWDSFESRAFEKLGTMGLDIFDDQCKFRQYTNPKLHTIRHDEKNLWVPGRKIHMVVFNRTKNRFQFAPVLEVKSIQYVRILWSFDEELRMKSPCLYLGEKEDRSDMMPWYYPFYGEKDMLQFVRNEGFDSIEHFYEWFNDDFEGKIIHWTNLKY